MAATVFCTGSVFRFPLFVTFSKQPNLGKPFLSLKETADGSSPFASQNDHPRSSVSSIRSDGTRKGRPSRKSFASGKPTEGDGNKIHQPSDGKSSKSSNQEDIIALFRRIQTSISKGESVRTTNRKSNSSEEPSADSVLHGLQQSRKQVKDRTSNKEGNKVLPRRRGAPKKQQEILDNTLVANFKLTRPRSNFVKKSPIPSPSTSKGKILELKSEASAATSEDEELKLPRVEEMKLPELKELAKSRGIKGYSKLKKGDLVQLLKS